MHGPIFGREIESDQSVLGKLLPERERERATTHPDENIFPTKIGGREVKL